MIRHQRTEPTVTTVRHTRPSGMGLGGGADVAAGHGLRERGASLIEYVLMIAMVAVVCIGALTYFGGASGNNLDRSKNCIVTAGMPTPDCPTK